MTHRWRSAFLATAIALAPAGGDALAAGAPTPPPESRSSEATPVAPGGAHPSTPPRPGAAPVVPAPPGDEEHSDRGGFGEDVTVAADETLDGNVTCVKGRVTIDGHVNGSVTVVAGDLTIRGSVTGDVTSVASRTTLEPGAVVDGQLVNVGGSLERGAAHVRGQVVNIPLGLNFGPWTGHLFPGWDGIGRFVFWIKMFALFLFFVCALLLAALVPDRIRLISEEAPHRFFTAFVFGLVGYVLFALIQVFLFATIIGIPLVFLLYLVFLVLKWLGMCGIFHHVGWRIGRGLGREMSLIGAILLGFLPFALLRFLPLCVGFTIWFAVEILAVGYLVVTRVGTRRETAVLPRPPVAPPPAGPVPSQAG